MTSCDENQLVFSDEGGLSLDDFKLWSTTALKTYLSIRKKPVNGSFETLVARAFSASEERVPVDSEKEHKERILLQEYKNKLTVEDESIPDPIDTKNGWLSEKDGLHAWPPLYFTDISRFYTDVIGNNRDLITRIESEYKQGKAYRYYTNSFINEVQIHLISEHSKFCILRTKCLPSQRVSSRQYDVWVIVRKTVTCSNGDVLGGQIMNGYCTCPAGLLGSCNHVAGLLFRIEAAVLIGVCQPTCTSMLSRWNIPSQKKQIKPDEITNILFKKSTYLKKSIQDNEKRQDQKNLKRNFNVMSPSQQAQLLDQEKVRREFFNDVRDIIPSSCFSEFMKGRKTISTNLNLNVTVPTIIECAVEFRKNVDENIDDENILVQKFTESLIFTDEQIEYLYNNTSTQSNNIIWQKHRTGRLTASNFKNLTVNYENLDIEKHFYNIISVMKYDNPVSTWQMKHGINTEPHAKVKFQFLFKKKHKGCKFVNPGILILKEHPYISCTPDLDVFCSCHGYSLVEIKCPSSLIGKIPTVKNYKHVEVVDGIINLKKNSEYYYQIQGQLAISGRKVCFFFVFTFEGVLEVEVVFNEKFWFDMLQKLCWFWKTFVAPEILVGELKKVFERSFADKSQVFIPRPSLLSLRERCFGTNIVQNIEYHSEIEIVVEK